MKRTRKNCSRFTEGSASGELIMAYPDTDQKMSNISVNKLKS